MTKRALLICFMNLSIPVVAAQAAQRMEIERVIELSSKDGDAKEFIARASKNIEQNFVEGDHTFETLESFFRQFLTDYEKCIKPKGVDYNVIQGLVLKENFNMMTIEYPFYNSGECEIRSADLKFTYFVDKFGAMNFNFKNMYGLFFKEAIKLYIFFKNYQQVIPLNTNLKIEPLEGNKVRIISSTKAYKNASEEVMKVHINKVIEIAKSLFLKQD